LRVRAGGGNQGFNQEHVFGSWLVRNWSETIAGDRDFSMGFIPDRDFRSTAASSETRVQTSLGQTAIMFAGSDRSFGADQFYGRLPLVGAHRELVRISATGNSETAQPRPSAIAGTPTSFVLVRDDPILYENNHIDQSWQAALRPHDSFSENKTLSYGARARETASTAIILATRPQS